MTDMQLCVQHDYQPKDGKEKMDGKIQHNYPKKNWSKLCAMELWTQASRIKPQLKNLLIMKKLQENIYTGLVG